MIMICVFIYLVKTSSSDQQEIKDIEKQIQSIEMNIQRNQYILNTFKQGRRKEDNHITYLELQQNEEFDSIKCVENILNRTTDEEEIKFFEKIKQNSEKKLIELNNKIINHMEAKIKYEEMCENNSAAIDKMNKEKSKLLKDIEYLKYKKSNPNI